MYISGKQVDLHNIFLLLAGCKKNRWIKTNNLIKFENFGGSLIINRAASSHACIRNRTVLFPCG